MSGTSFGTSFGLWLWNPLIFTPIIPWAIRFRIGDPIPADELFVDDDLVAALARVEGAVQRLVEQA